MVHVHVVWAHPRQDSLTASVVCELVDSFTSAGSTVDVLDLYRSDFDPSLGELDEPHWDEPERAYSQEVRDLADRVQRADLVILAFPVWWYSLPAMMKGYIDRVWNYGLLYGNGKRIAATVRWVVLVGWPEQTVVECGFDRMIVRHLNSGIAGFCGVEDSEVHLLYDSMADPDVARFTRGARAVAATSLTAATRPGSEITRGEGPER